MIFWEWNPPLTKCFMTWFHLSRGLRCHFTSIVSAPKRFLPFNWTEKYFDILQVTSHLLNCSINGPTMTQWTCRQSFDFREKSATGCTFREAWFTQKTNPEKNPKKSEKSPKKIRNKIRNKIQKNPEKSEKNPEKFRNKIRKNPENLRKKNPENLRKKIRKKIRKNRKIRKIWKTENSSK